MRMIPLTRGKFALVDNDDFHIVSRHKWYARRHRHGPNRREQWYAVRTTHVGDRVVMINMHNEILNVMPVDHANGDGLNNQFFNLRPATVTQNNFNARKRAKTSSSRFKGVHWCSTRKKWIAKITFLGQNNYLGQFPTEELAAAAYAEKAKQIAGPFFNAGI